MSGWREAGTTHADVRDPIRVMIVDDHAVVRRGIAAFLEETADITIVGEASDGEEALERFRRLRAAGTAPHVVLADLIMPGIGGIETTRRIKAEDPSTVVIVLTSFGEADRVRSALAAGAAGYLLKDTGVDELVLAIRAGRRGGIHLDAAVTRQMTQPIRVAGQLTPREWEVLRLVAAGRSNQDVADRMSISERTVRTHLGSIFGKLGVSSRTQAALWARDRGIDARAEIRLGDD